MSLDTYFSSATEVLTDKGWMLGKDITRGSLVLTMNNDTQLLEYKEVVGVNIDTSVNKKLIRPLGHSFGFEISNEHGMIFYSYRNNTYAGAVNKDRPRLNNFSKLPGRFYVRPCGYLNKPGLNLSLDEVAFLVQIVTDGSLERGKYLRFHLKKERKILRLRSLLNRLSINFTEAYVEKTGKTKIYVGRIASKYMSYFPGGIKRLPDEFMDLNHSQVDALYREYAITDGSQQGTTVQISTNKEVEVNLLQAILSTSGYKTIINDRTKKSGGWTLYALKKEFALLHNKTSYKESINRDYVWNLQVDNNSILTRCNGKTVITQAS